MTVMSDGVSDDPSQRPPPSPPATRRSPSPLDLRRGGEHAPRLPFSISSLLSSSLSSHLSSHLSATSRELLGRAERDQLLARDQLSRDLLSRDLLARDQLSRDLLSRDHLLSRDPLSRDQLSREQLSREQISRESRELSVRGDRDLLQPLDSDADSDAAPDESGHDDPGHDESGHACHDDDDDARDESHGEDDEEPGRNFQPYAYTHMPFAAGLLPHLHGLLPSLGGLGGVIRVPAHRPPLGGSLAGSLGGGLPWLAGLTPLERTAAMAHHLSSLAPMPGWYQSIIIIILSLITLDL